MKLADFIHRNLEMILQEWETFAGTLMPEGASMSTSALRDHARQILLAVAADMETDQTMREQKRKSLGQGPDVLNAADTAATIHGELRHEVGFDLVKLVAEYRALRASVLRLWIRQGLGADARDFDDMLRFNEAIDQAIAESVSSFSSELAKARDTFTAILGHDLRSPLGAILMSAHNAVSHGIPEPAARAVETIQRSAKAMETMIRDLLDFAGARLGREMPMRPEESSLVETCDAALAEVRAAHPGRTFDFESGGDLRGVFDPARVGQALSNLLNNAINHGDTEHPVTMRARVESRELIVEVINKGKTIPPETLRAIMDPATRVHLPRSDGSSGLGLGLFIAQQVAKAHGGAMTAVSLNDETRFSFRLPRWGRAPEDHEWTSNASTTT